MLTLRGGGAAGGLAAGLAALCGASVESGFDIVAEAIGLEATIAGADAVITGEGRLDAHGKPVAVIAGIIDSAHDAAASPFDACEGLLRAGMTVEYAMAHAAELLTATAARIAGRTSAWLA